jgi:hypothetical protein
VNRENGSASLWLLGFVLVFWVTAIGAVGVGQAVIARHRVAAAADLGVLAGAGVLADAAVEAVGSAGGAPSSVVVASVSAATRTAACARASSVTAANGAEVTECTVTATTVDIVAALSLNGLGSLFQPGTAVSATARAGLS